MARTSRTQQAPAADSAVAASTRILGYDIARAFAFLGMVIVNYKVIMFDYWSAEEARQPAWLNGFMDLFPGRAAATFVILAGVGLTLLHRAHARREEPARLTTGGIVRYLVLLLLLALGALVVDGHAARVENGMVDHDGFIGWWSSFRDHVRDFSMNTFTWSVAGGLVGLLLLTPWLGRPTARAVLFRRGLFLLALGFAWYPAWSGDILHFYGVYLVLGALLVGLPGWILAILLVAAVAGGAAAQYQWPYWDSWARQSLEYRDLWTIHGAVRNTFINGWHPVLPWLGFLILGVLIGRMDASRRSRAVVLVLIGTAVTAGFKLRGDDAKDAWRSVLAARTRSMMAHEELVAPERWSAAGAGGAEVAGGIEVAVERDESTPGMSRAARSIARLLRRDRDRWPYSRCRLVNDGEAGSLALEVDYGEGVGVPDDGERDLDTLVYDLTRAWARARGEGARRGWGARQRWPDEVTRVVVRRSFPVEGSGPSPVHEVVDRTVIGVDDIDGAERLARLERMSDTGSTPPGTAYVIAAAGTSLIVIGLCLLLSSFAFLARFWVPFVATGQMALTLYVYHVGALFPLFDSVGMKERRDVGEIAINILLCWSSAIVFATLWRAVFRRGPLEMLMRSAAG